jgi:hypothetical protein
MHSPGSFCRRTVALDDSLVVTLEATNTKSKWVMGHGMTGSPASRATVVNSEFGLHHELLSILRLDGLLVVWMRPDREFSIVLPLQRVTISIPVASLDLRGCRRKRIYKWHNIIDMWHNSANSAARTPNSSLGTGYCTRFEAGLKTGNFFRN